VCGRCGVCNRKRPKVTKQGGLCNNLLTCIREVPGLNIAGDTVEFEGFHGFTQPLLAKFGIVPSIRSRSLPATYFTIRVPLSKQPLDVMYSELLTAFFSKRSVKLPRTFKLMSLRIVLGGVHKYVTSTVAVRSYLCC